MNKVTSIIRNSVAFFRAVWLAILVPLAFAIFIAAVVPLARAQTVVPVTGDTTVTSRVSLSTDTIIEIGQGVTLTGSVATWSSSDYAGVYTSNRVLTFTGLGASNLIMVNNRAGYGSTDVAGAIFTSGPLMAITGSYNNILFISNTTYLANTKGGAIAVDSGNLSINTQTTGTLAFINNFARDNGGALSTRGGLVVIGGTYGNVFFTSNYTQSGNGGAIASSHGVTIDLFTADTMSFTNNFARYHGGALHTSGGPVVIGGTYGNVFFTSNYTQSGAGGAIASAQDVTIDLFTAGTMAFSNNIAGAGNGGAISGGSVSIKGDYGSLFFTSNTTTSPGVGGAIFSDRDIIFDVNIKDSLLIENNRSAGVGGGAFNAGGSILLNIAGTGDISISNNTSSSGGSAFRAYGDIFINSAISGTLAIINNNGAGAFAANNVTIQGNYDGLLIRGNSTSSGFGSAISSAGAASPTLFYESTAIMITGNYGAGGIYIDSNKGRASFYVANGTMAISATSSGLLAMTNNNGSTWGGVLDGGASTFGLNTNSVDFLISGSYGGLLVQNNSSTGVGGAVSLTGPRTLMRIAGDFGEGGIIFNSNTASSGGGAIISEKDIIISATTSGTLAITNNLARTGGGYHGGAFSAYSGSMVIEGNIANILVASNTINNDKGGAFYADKGFTLIMANNTVLTATANKAADAASGGFLYVKTGSMIFDIGNNATATIGSASSYAAAQDSIAAGTGVSLYKNGAGSLSLWGTGTYSSPTYVNAGSLYIYTPSANTRSAIGIAILNVAAGAATYLRPNASVATYSMDNALAGAGLLDVSLFAVSDTIAFTNATTSFSGTVNFHKGIFTLTTSRFAGTHLISSAGNLFIVGTGENKPASFEFDGGAVRFDLSASGSTAKGWINTPGLVTIDSGSIQIDPNNIGSFAGSAPLLLQDDIGSGKRTLVRGSSVSGTIADLDLVDIAGNLITAPTGNYTGDIVQNNTATYGAGNTGTTAIGTYLNNVRLAQNGTEIYLVGGKLVKLDLRSGKTTVLSGDTGTPAPDAYDMKAQIIGTGTLLIDATGTIALSGTNTNTGGILLRQGTLLADTLGNAAWALGGKNNIISYDKTATVNNSRLLFNTTSTLTQGQLVLAGANATLEAAPGVKLTVSSTANPGYGGAVNIAVGGTYTVIGDVIFDGNRNSTSAFGGAIYIERGGRLNLNTDSIIFTNNASYQGGGAIAARATTDVVIDGIFKTILFASNTVLKNENTGVAGGAIYVGGGGAVIISATAGSLEFSKNQSGNDITAVSGGGGAISTFGSGTILITGSYGNILIDSNKSPSSNGGAFHGNTEINVVTDSLVFSNNEASRGSSGGGGGGAISGGLTLSGTYDKVLIVSNTAGTSGGAISGGLTVNNATYKELNISNNTAGGQGGAIESGIDLNTAPNSVFTATNNKALGNYGYDINSGFLYGSSGSMVFNIDGSSTATIGHAQSVANITDGISSAANVPLVKDGAGILTLWGQNAYKGNTIVKSGTLYMATPVASSTSAFGTGTLNIAAGAETYIAPNASFTTYTFINSLAGEGLLDVNLYAASNTFAISVPSGNYISTFTGTVNFHNAIYTLERNRFAKADVVSSAGNVFIVGTGSNPLDTFTFNGGAVRFDLTDNASFPGYANGWINTNAATITSGTIQISNTGGMVSSNTYNLLQQDDRAGGGKILVHSVATISGTIDDLVVTDTLGNPLNLTTISSTAAVNQTKTALVGAAQTGLTAVGYYEGGALTQDANNITIGGGQLVQLNLLNNKTTVLDGDLASPSGANEFHAWITGPGNLWIAANNAITINNGTNTYTGKTTVSSGTLILGGSGTANLGRAAKLDIRNGATVDINGKLQTLFTSTVSGTLLVNGGTIFTTGSLLIAGYADLTAPNSLLDRSSKDIHIGGSGTAKMIIGANSIVRDLEYISGGQGAMLVGLGSGKHGYLEIRDNGYLVDTGIQYYYSTLRLANDDGDGTLIIKNSGSAYIEGLTIGYSGAGKALVEVRDDAHLESIELNVGSPWSGVVPSSTFIITDRARVDTKNIHIGTAGNGAQTVVVSGSGHLNVTEKFRGQGHLGTGTHSVTIQNSGSITSNGVNMQADTPQWGAQVYHLTVKDSGVWLNEGNFIVSGADIITSTERSTLTIQDNAMLVTTGTILGDDGMNQINLNGGLLRAGELAGYYATTPVANRDLWLIFNGGTLQAGQNNAGFISDLRHGITFNAGGGYIDTQAFNVGISGVQNGDVVGSAFLGSGALHKIGSGTLTIGSASALYTGNVYVDQGTILMNDSTTAIGTGTAVIAQNAALGAQFAQNYTMANALAGQGLLYVDLNSYVRLFALTGNSAAFTGTALLRNNTYTLQNGNFSAATLVSSAQNTTIVHTGSNQLGGIVFDGGAVRFDLTDNASFPDYANGWVNTNAATITNGSIQISNTGGLVGSSTHNLLQQDDRLTGSKILVHSAATISGTIDSLTVTDTFGISLPLTTISSTAAVNQTKTALVGAAQTGLTAIGHYEGSAALSQDAHNITIGGGQLVQLDLLANKTTVLEGDDTGISGASEFHAKITGTGNLWVAATNTIALNNTANNYSGTTTVSQGTLLSGTHNALGNTAQLRALTGGVANLANTTQTIAGRANTAVLAQGGTVTNTAGGRLTISTTGNNAHGAQASGPGSLVDLTDANITTKGTWSAGVVSSTQGVFDITGGTIATSGTYGIGAYVLGTSSGTLNNVVVSTTGYAAEGVYVLDSSTISVTGGTLATTGTQAHGLWAGGTSSAKLANVDIATADFNAIGAYIDNGSKLTANGGAIETTGSRAFGVLVYGASSTAGLNAVAITTEGDDAQGIFVTTSAAATITAADVTTSGSQSHGIYVRNTGTAKVIGGQVTTTGDEAHGVYSSTASNLAASNLTIETQGANAAAIAVTVQGKAALDNGAFTTTDASSAGILATGGTVTVDNSAFTVAGDLVKTSGGAGNTITLTGITSTNGDNILNALDSGTTSLTINTSALTGALVSNNTALANIALASGTLTGKSARNDTSTLNLAVGANSAWKATDTSSLTNLANNDGLVDLVTARTTSTAVTLDIEGAFTQTANGTLRLALTGTNTPVITASSAVLSGTIDISGASLGGAAARASQVASGTQIVIATSAPGKITDDFTAVTGIVGNGSGVDYIIGTYGKDTTSQYWQIETGLAWYASTGTAHGKFTLTNAADAFDVDVALADRADTFTSGWTGKNLVKNGDGTLTLSARNTYTGTTFVNAGKLALTGYIASPETIVAGNATLAGTGTTAGNVTINTGGHLAPGASPGVLTIEGNLALNDGAILDFELGKADVPDARDAANDLIDVTGNLNITGTALLNVDAQTGFSIGVYRLINYTTALNLINGGTIAFNSLTGAKGSLTTDDFLVDFSQNHQVNLIQRAGDIMYWDGPSTSNDNKIQGGTGIWNAATGGNSNWTSDTGGSNNTWSDGKFAIFGYGANALPGGTVTVENDLGEIKLSGAQFIIGGYTIASGSLTLVHADDTTESSIIVGDNTAGDAAKTATINSILTGTANLEKLGAGTLVLGGANTYTGTTNVAEGQLKITNAAAIGANTLNVEDGATFTAALATNYTMSNTLTGEGLVNIDLGSAANTFTVGASQATPSFTGTARLAKSAYTLEHGDFTNATLVTAAGNKTTVATGSNHTANFGFDGGTVDFSLTTGGTTADGWIHTGTLAITAAGGTVATNATANGIGGTKPLLQQDEGMTVKLIGADALDIDPTGNLSIEGGASTTAAIKNASAVTTATATYGQTLSTQTAAGEKGLFINYELTQLALVAGQTTTLDSDAAPSPSGAAELHAKITGPGSLAINANGSGTITLNNTNTYTGTTTVRHGTLLSGANNALGNTAQLTVQPGSVVDMQGRAQNITQTAAGAPLVSITTGTVYYGTGTLSTAVANTGAILATNGALFTGTNLTVKVTGDLVTFNGASGDTNTVTLDKVKATNGANVMTSAGDATSALAIKNSTLTGNLLSSGNGIANVALTASTLTGMSSRSGASTLNLALDSASTWVVTANSTLTDLDNNGTVDFKTVANSFKTVTMENLTGNGIFKMNVSIHNYVQRGDKLVINNLAQGTHQIVIKRPWNDDNRTREFALLLVSALDASAADFTNTTGAIVQQPLTGAVGYGMRTATIERGNAAYGSLGATNPNNWYLILPDEVSVAALSVKTAPAPAPMASAPEVEIAQTENTSTTIVNDPVPAPAANNEDTTPSSAITTATVTAADAPAAGQAADETRLAADAPVSAQAADETHLGSDIPAAPAPISPAQVVLGSAVARTFAWFDQDNLTRRMGELHTQSGLQTAEGNAPDAQQQHAARGWQAWVRTSASRYNVDATVTGETNFRQNIYTLDVGTDKRFDTCANSRTHIGAFGSYSNSNIDYRYNGSDGDITAFAAGAYLTWVHRSGLYADVTLKGMRFANNFTGRDDSGNLTKADNGSWALGGSAEIGWQLAIENGWFVQPSASARYGHFFSNDYTTGGHNRFRVSQDATDALQTSFGVSAGRTFRITKDGRPTGGYVQPYVKGAAMKQRSSGGKITTFDGVWNANADGWADILGAGVVWQIDSANQFYVNYEALFADDYKKPFNLSLGYRRQF